MWQAASCIVLGGGLPLVGGANLVVYTPFEFRRAMTELFKKALCSTCLGVTDGVFSLVGGTILIILLAGSRIFLVVEAFLSLRSLPLGAYSTVTWAKVLHHIG